MQLLLETKSFYTCHQCLTWDLQKSRKESIKAIIKQNPCSATNETSPKKPQPSATEWDQVKLLLFHPVSHWSSGVFCKCLARVKMLSGEISATEMFWGDFSGERPLKTPAFHSRECAPASQALRPQTNSPTVIQGSPKTPRKNSKPMSPGKSMQVYCDISNGLAFWLLQEFLRGARRASFLRMSLYHGYYDRYCVKGGLSTVFSWTC